MKMSRLSPLALLAGTVFAGTVFARTIVLELTTAYTPERSLTIESETAWDLSTSEMEMTRGGEPIEPRGERERPSLTEARHLVVHDTVIEESDGTPAVIHREFESIGTRFELEDSANGSRDLDSEAPLEGVTLKLERADDEVEVTVIDGDSPGADHTEGHRLELALDALLAEGDVEVGSEWELEGEAIRRALSLDLGPVLFPAPEREAAGEGRRERGRGAAMREPLGQLLAQAEWSGTAELVDMEDELEGLKCVRVELEIEASHSASGEVEASGPGGRGGRGGTMERTTEIEVELEGDLFFSIEEGRPVLLRLEGDLSLERHVVRGGGERGFEVRVLQEGEFSHSTLIRENE